MATREEIVRAIEQFQVDVEQAVGDMPEASWLTGVYEGGWNARQILSHIASTSGVAGFILNMSHAPSPSLPAGFFDVDDFNKTQVAMRAGRSVDDVLPVT